MADYRRAHQVPSISQAIVFVLGMLVAQLVVAKEGIWDTKFMVGDDPYLQIHCAWNAPQRVGGPYASAAWPRGALAAERALLFAARQVLREEWKIGRVIAAEHPGGGHAQLAEAETNFYKEHTVKEMTSDEPSTGRSEAK